jgi:hypothetical protein
MLILVIMFSSILDMIVFVESNENEDKIISVLKVLFEIICVGLLTYGVLRNLKNFSIILGETLINFFPLILLTVIIIVNYLLKTKMKDKFAYLSMYFFGNVKKQTKKIISYAKGVENDEAESNSNNYNSNKNKLSDEFKKIYYKHKIKDRENQFNLNWYYPELKNNVNKDVKSGKFQYINLKNNQIETNNSIEIRQEM